MAWLRSNFRIKARDLDFDAVGLAINQYIAGSSVQTDRRFGGFVFGSFASQLAGVGFWNASAYELMGSTYGVTMVSNLLGSGFKVIPFGFMDQSWDGASNAPMIYFLSVTQGLGIANDSTVIIVARKGSITAGASGIVMNSASNISVHFTWFGWIVSSPDQFR